MRIFFLLLLLFLPIQVLASDLSGSFCSENLEKDDISCEERDRIAHRLQGFSIFFSAITVASACTPEPFITKVHAAIFSISSLFSTTASFFVRGMDCDTQDRLSWDEQEQTIELICKQLGKPFIQSSEPFQHSHCGA